MVIWGSFLESMSRAWGNLVRVSPDALRDKTRRMIALFKEIDADVARFQKVSRLECLVPCGECCEHPMVETTELEMLPMAQVLIAAGKAEAIYNQAEKHDFSGRCIFFRPQLGPGDRGHCTMYAYRPLVCRLFNAATNCDKYGKRRLVVCAPTKDRAADHVSHLQDEIAAGRINPPDAQKYRMMALAIDAEMERDGLPINLAFKLAVDRLWIHQRFSRVAE